MRRLLCLVVLGSCVLVVVCVSGCGSSSQISASSKPVVREASVIPAADRSEKSRPNVVAQRRVLRRLDRAHFHAAARRLPRKRPVARVAHRGRFWTRVLPRELARQRALSAIAAAANPAQCVAAAHVPRAVFSRSPTTLRRVSRSQHAAILRCVAAREHRARVLMAAAGLARAGSHGVR